MTGPKYPRTNDERRAIVQHLSAAALELDAEASWRRMHDGTYSGIVRDELERSAGVIRFVATLIVQGGMSTRKAKFWMVAVDGYMRMVKRADIEGVIP